MSSPLPPASACNDIAHDRYKKPQRYALRLFLYVLLGCSFLDPIRFSLVIGRIPYHHRINDV